MIFHLYCNQLNAKLSIFVIYQVYFIQPSIFCYLQIIKQFKKSHRINKSRNKISFNLLYNNQVQSIYLIQFNFIKQLDNTAMHQNYNIKQNKTNIMSSTIDPVKLYQLSIHYDRHKLKLNRIKSQSSPMLRKQKQQISIMTSRNTHQQYNTKFKYKQNMNQINKKNTKILDKLSDLSRIKSRPSSIVVDRLRNSMVLNRSVSKRQDYKKLQVENQRFVKKLFSVKSNLSQNNFGSSFWEHKNRSQMLSKFKRSQFGQTIPKSQSAIKNRINLDSVHKKLQIIQSKTKEIKQINISKSPLKFNTIKLLKINPERK